MTRREAREAALTLIFEMGFHPENTAEDILERACAMREFETNEYITKVFCGLKENLEFVDGLISKYSHGWSQSRISPVSRAVMRLAIYEMYFCEDVPDTAAINEAIELVKKYDDAERVRPFVNGVLNSVLKEKNSEDEA